MKLVTLKLYALEVSCSVFSMNIIKAIIQDRALTNLLCMIIFIIKVDDI